MVRLISVPSVLVVLGLAGLAMAQDGLIVDPWHRIVASVGGTQAARAPVSPRPVGIASFPIDEPKTQPAVVPIGPPLKATGETSSIEPVGPAFVDGPTTHDEVFDPWAGSANAPSSSPLVAAHAGHRDWAFEINEIIDPWSKGPLAAVTDPLIVDPWAR